MLISHNWLQKYFEEKLPEPNDLAKLLNSHSFEVEAVEPKGNDTIFDIDVLPNRAHDCLCHRGMAKEVSVITGLKFKDINHTNLEVEPLSDFSIKIEDEKKCRRYVAVEIEGVKVGDSPDWLKESLGSIGQKSINNIVDATNYVMFNVGQPLHAFDKDKLDGSEIIIRNAKDGEHITTLDNKEVDLNSENLVIADSKDALAIAGVKGGKKAEVDENTTNLVLESANFAPITVRKTSRGHSILTDSSKRFENELSTELAGVAMRELAELIQEIAGGEVVGKTDVYPRKPNAYKVGFITAEANKLLGLNLSNKDVEEILNKFKFQYEKVKPFSKVIEMAESLVGVPYESGSSVVYDAPNKFDCSSFTSYLFAQVGIAIPRISVDQYVFGKEISKDELKVGDLVFANTGIVEKTGIHTETKEFLPGTLVPEGVDHVGIYIGEEKIIHTSSRTEKVVVEELEKAEMFKNIVGYRRIADEDAERYVITVPYERMDIRIKEDVIEEIGRIYGLENIKELPLEKIKEPKVHKVFYYENKVRQILSDLGFQEVYNYTFRDKGEVKIEKPLASDKAMLRTNLSDGMKDKLEVNLKNAPLLGLDEIKIFEIGKVFPSIDEEHNSLCIGTTGKFEESQNLSDLGIKFPKDGILEINFDELVEKLPQPESYGDVLKNTDDSEIKYKHISPYPFMLRDIAVWVPNENTEEDVLNLIKENATKLLVRPPKLFDTYKPEGENRTSYAFNLVFQAQDRTLTDEDVNLVMDKVIAEMQNKNWEVR